VARSAVNKFARSRTRNLQVAYVFCQQWSSSCRTRKRKEKKASAISVAGVNMGAGVTNQPTLAGVIFSVPLLDGAGSFTAAWK